MCTQASFQGIACTESLHRRFIVILSWSLSVYFSSPLPTFEGHFDVRDRWAPTRFYIIVHCSIDYLSFCTRRGEFFDFKRDSFLAHEQFVCCSHVPTDVQSSDRDNDVTHAENDNNRITIADPPKFVTNSTFYFVCLLLSLKMLLHVSSFFCVFPLKGSPILSRQREWFIDSTYELVLRILSTRWKLERGRTCCELLCVQAIRCRRNAYAWSRYIFEV